MLRVTKRTFQVATRKTYKYSRSSRVEAFTLQAIKYLVNLPLHPRPSHILPHCLPTLGFPPYSTSVSGRKSNAPCFLLFFHNLLDTGKIYYHPVCIQLARTAIDGDNPIMPVQILAFAGIGQRQAMCSRHLHSFDNCIHVLRVLLCCISRHLMSPQCRDKNTTFFLAFPIPTKTS